jgi:hypothetical protein
VSTSLSEAGRRAEALAAAQEAVKMRRELVEANRDAHLPHLAQSVYTLAIQLGKAGPRAKALALAREASAHYDLAQTEPDVFSEAASRADEFVATLSKDTP